MPYQDITELPENVRSVLPGHAQEIYKEAFNHAWGEYKDPDKRRDSADRVSRTGGTPGGLERGQTKI
jgi:cation transport regulator